MLIFMSGSREGWRRRDSSARWPLFKMAWKSNFKSTCDVFLFIIVWFLCVNLIRPFARRRHNMKRETEHRESKTVKPFLHLYRWTTTSSHERYWTMFNDKTFNFRILKVSYFNIYTTETFTQPETKSHNITLPKKSGACETFSKKSWV